MEVFLIIFTLIRFFNCFAKIVINYLANYKNSYYYDSNY